MCTLNPVSLITTELCIVSELMPGDRLTVPDGEPDTSLRSLPTIERAGLFQSLVRMCRGQSREQSLQYIRSLAARLIEMDTADLSREQVEALIDAIDGARAGVNSLKSTYQHDTRVVALLTAHQAAFGIVGEALVRKKASM